MTPTTPPNISIISSFIDSLLKPEQFKDIALNGIQIHGNRSIKKLACAVDAGISTIEKAIEINADALLVHHGIFWGQCKSITGPHKSLVKKTLDADLSLLAYHLPLDASVLCGNNFELAKTLSLDSLEAAPEYKGTPLGCIGSNSSSQTREAIEKKLLTLAGTTPQTCTFLPFGPDIPGKICIVSGAAADGLYEHAQYDFDTFITGEPRQFAYHFCKEHRLNALFIGHYASETLGVQALSELIANKFSLQWEFIDEPTGI